MWQEYVPVAKRLARAKRCIGQLRKKGKTIRPVEVESRVIAKKFWGKRWCDHIETFSDYANRLPRGRSYVRNGSICHLEINKGCIKALVMGSSLYKVSIDVKAFPLSKWEIIKNNCSGQISSLLEILTGNLSDHVMEVVTNDQNGLFPKEAEIEYFCNCLDWADMCKHVAAVFYGVGHRLDEIPELLFQLRGVDAKDLIKSEMMTFKEEGDDALSDTAISDIFDIDLDEEPKPTEKLSKKPLATTKEAMPDRIDPQAITGKQLKNMRIKMKLTVKKFAQMLNVTPASIYRWEKEEMALCLRHQSTQAIAAVLKKNQV